MSKLEKLIKKLCPNGVEYKELNTLVDYIQPTKYIVKSTKYNDEYDIPVLTPGQTFILGYTNEKEGIYNADKENPIILFDDFTTAFRWINFKFKVKSSAVKILIPKNNNINFRYIFYTMQTIKFDNTQHNRQWISKYSILKIPVPPIEVQNEIVRILDNFTKLEAELEAELEVRKKQYEHYRDEVFRFKNNKNVEYKKLGKIATISRGGNFQKKDFVSNGFPCIHYGQIYTKYGLYANKVTTFISESTAKKSKIAKPNDIIMAVTSENVEDVCKCVAWVGKENIAVSGHTAIIHSELNAKYLSYYFHTNMFYTQKLKYVHGTKVIEFTPKNLENIEIPIVSNEEQEKIVSILDRFDKLCNDITQGLPAEIEARRKQYEYYRDKLLNFKELKVEK